MNETFRIALDLLLRGYSLLPIRFRGKKPDHLKLKQSGYKRGSKSHWKYLQFMQPSIKDVMDWFYQDQYSNLGIITGNPNNLLAIDFDTQDPYYEFKRLYEEKNGPLDTIIVESNRGFHVYFISSEPVVASQLLDDRGKVIGDIKANGGYLLYPPSVHPSRKVYKFENRSDVPIRIQNISDLSIYGVYQSHKTIQISKPKRRTNSIDRDQVIQLLTKLPPIYSDQYFYWIRVGMILKNNLDEDGFSLFDQFSRRSKKYDPIVVRRYWNRLRKVESNGLGIGTLVHWAEKS